MGIFESARKDYLKKCDSVVKSFMLILAESADAISC